MARKVYRDPLFASDDPDVPASVEPPDPTDSPAIDALETVDQTAPDDASSSPATISPPPFAPEPPSLALEEPESGRPRNGELIEETFSPVAAAAPESVRLGDATYRLVKKLGEGGMAEVFLAMKVAADSEFERSVAIKRVLPHYAADELFKNMFREEARLTARLRHRNIGQLLEFHSSPTGHYLVMEFVEGFTLREVIRLSQSKGTALTEAFACYVTSQIADALDYAHRAKDAQGRPLNVVHRDVTPGNVMIAQDGDVKLLDFGIARSSIEGRERTATGLLKGKFAYMSPEQANGEGPLDGRSDLFSLGIVLAELLTRKRVFDAPSEARIIKKVCDCDPEQVKAALGEIAPPLHDIILRLLSKNPSDRPSTGAELSQQLRQHIRQQLYGPHEAAAELERLAALPDVKESTATMRPPASMGGTPSVGAPPVASGSPPAAVLPAVSVPKASGTAIRQREELLRRVRNPKVPTRKLMWILVVLAALILGGNLVVTAIIHSNGGGSPARREVMKTPEQERAEREAENKAIQPTGQLAELGAAVRVAPTPEAAPATGQPAPTQAPPSVAPSKAAVPARAKSHKARGAVPTPVVAVAQEPVPAEPRRRSLESSTLPEADDAPASPSGAKVPKTTLLPAVLLGPADPYSPGPVLVEISADVSEGGVVAVPKHTAVSCTSSAVSQGRLSISCDSLNLPGRGQVAFEGVVMARDKRVGLLVGAAGTSDAPEPDEAKDGALAIADRLVDSARPDGVAGDVASEVAHRTHSAATKPGPTRAPAAHAAPKGTKLFIYVKQGF